MSMSTATRLQLSPKATKTLRKLADAFDAGDLRSAEAHWLLLSMQLPDHPRTLRWQGKLCLASREPLLAAKAFESSLQKQPNEPGALLGLATALAAMGDWDAGRNQLLQAAAHTVSAAGWLQVGLAFDAQGHAADALAASEAALKLDPSLAKAGLLRARVLHVLGDTEGAARAYRRLLGNRQAQPAAWFGLLDLKSVALLADELASLERYAALPHPSEDKLLLAFALATAYEAAGLYAQAAFAFTVANRNASAQRPWSTARLQREVVAIETAFGSAPNSNRQSGFQPGSQVIFVTGLPRSGTTLFEQILAAHPQVEASGELPYLEQILSRESVRRGHPFPLWVAGCSSNDWARLGEEYLSLTARFRSEHAVMTDKAPNNWLLAGAAMAMLPGAHFLHCHRDAVETCWSCFKQLFGLGQAHFAYDFDHLAHFWQTSEHVSRFWEAHHAGNFSRRCYED